MLAEAATIRWGRRKGSEHLVHQSIVWLARCHRCCRLPLQAGSRVACCLYEHVRTKPGKEPGKYVPLPTLMPPRKTGITLSYIRWCHAWGGGTRVDINDQDPNCRTEPTWDQEKPSTWGLTRCKHCAGSVCLGSSRDGVGQSTSTVTLA